MRHRVLVACLVAVCLGGLAAPRVQTQSPAPADVMPALLVEVRRLGAAMEQIASGAARVQLALGRLQLQEQRLGTAIRRLDETRSRLIELQRSAADHKDQMARAEIALHDHRVEVEAAQLEQMLNHQRRLAARFAEDIQRLSGEEQVLAGEVSDEQARWSAYNARLEELERSLERR